MKRYFLIIVAILAFNIGFAQDFFDALRYSQTEYGGTARSIAMGSAFGALGGDFVSASINPAGLGLYRSNEFSFSSALNFNNIESKYLNNTESENRTRFNLNNLSFISSTNTNVESGIVSLTFGIGFNRLKDFNNRSFTQGFNAQTSLLNYYTDNANSPYTSPDKLESHYEGLAYQSYLINEDEDLSVIEGIYYNHLTDYQEYEINDQNGDLLGYGFDAIAVMPHQQKKSTTTSGGMNEYLMSLGLNINHKVYFGGSIGLVSINYGEHTIYSEIDDNNKSAYLKNFNLVTDINESGMGVNFKTGIIYRPFKSLRIGASVHTPTFYEIAHNENKKIDAYFDQELGNDKQGFSTHWNDKSTQNFYYQLETPFKAILSAAYTFSNKALISVDYENVNYSNTKFREVEGDDFDYSMKNSENNKIFTSASNLRIGGEARITPNTSLRAGFNYFGNPWEKTITYTDGLTAEVANNGDTYLSYTGGLGYRQNNFYVDFAYRLNQQNYTTKVHEIFYTNPVNGNALANFTELNHQATITLGFRF